LAAGLHQGLASGRAKRLLVMNHQYCAVHP